MKETVQSAAPDALPEELKGRLNRSRGQDERSRHIPLEAAPATPYLRDLSIVVGQLRLRVHLGAPAPLAAPVSRDADDDVVLATAVAANATEIVTGDLDLLVLRRYSGIDIVTPRDFLSRLRRARNASTR